MADGTGGKANLTHHRTIRRGRWRVTLILFLLSALLCVVSAEVAARAFWRLFYGVSLRAPSRILHAFYPELKKVDAQQPAHSDAFYDVLLLGASTLHNEWGQVEQNLLEQLAYNGHHHVRIFNLAKKGHTSRDSRLKYAGLTKARFELVVVYDGINDVRTNNVPPEVFHEDYNHFLWYKIVNTLAPYHGTASFALPYTLRRLAIGMQNAVTKDRYVPTDSQLPTDKPREDWLHYGRARRSAVSFKNNLGAILDLARRRGDRVLLMTFATYVPIDYSLQAFRAKHLDYGLHISPVEIWGLSEHVLETMAVHNEIVRSLAVQHEGVLFVDQAKLMAGNPRHFNDICHFTAIGSTKFAENLFMGLLPSLKNRTVPRMQPANLLVREPKHPPGLVP